MLQPSEFVLQRLVVEPKPRHGMAQLLVLPPQTRHFANQLANQVDQLGRRLPFKRIGGARTHPQLKSHPFLTSPFRPKFAPEHSRPWATSSRRATEEIKKPHILLVKEANSAGVALVRPARGRVDLPTKKARRQIDQKKRAAAPFVEERIEFNEIERG